MSQHDRISPTALVILMLLGGHNQGSTSAAAAPTRGFMESQGARIYYEAQGSGEPVVLIHGGAVDRRMWDSQFEAFADRYFVIRYDVPGLGKSEMPVHEFSHAEVLRDLLNYLDVERASIVGLSLGGAIALDFSVEYPEMATALVLSGPGVNGIQWSAESIERSYELYEIARSQGVRQAAEKSLEDPYLAPAMENPAIRQRIRDMTLDNAQHFLQYAAVRWAAPAAVNRLDRVYCPTFILVGDRDTPDIFNVVELLSDQLPDVERRVVNDAGHILPMEQPNEFNRLVLDFLERRVKSELACIPRPAHRAREIRNDPVLRWVAGDAAAAHDVYFGADYESVARASRSDSLADTLVSRDQPGSDYRPESLAFNTTYYWRVDEVDGATIRKGDVWHFRTGDYAVVDDFEDDHDVLPRRPGPTWLDSGGPLSDSEPPNRDRGNGTNATVGYAVHRMRGEDGEQRFMESSIVRSGRTSMPLFYDNTIAPFVSRVDRVFTKPQDWSRGGLEKLSMWVHGNHRGLGGHSLDADEGRLTVTGAGADVWGRSDQFHYVYRRLKGAGFIQAQVSSLANTDDPGATDIWAKAGLMIRETLEPDAVFADVFLTPGQGCHFQARRTAGEEAIGDSVGEDDVDTDEQNAIEAPYWVKLERTSLGVFNAYFSRDGSDWIKMAWSPQTIPMKEEVYIGLLVTSHAVGVPCQAEFLNVTVAGTAGDEDGGNWKSQDIGIQSNDKEPIYAVIRDSGSGIAAVMNPDANATVTVDWRLWTIDLAEDVASRGVDLTKIKQFSIGIGDQQATAPGGKGLVFVDDIRLSVKSPLAESGGRPEIKP